MKVMESYSNSDKKLVMTLEEYSPMTTNSQYKFYQALLIQGSEASGYTYKEFEDELINEFAAYKYERSILGEMVKKRKEVSEMNRKEFNMFIEQCIQFSNEFYGTKF